MFVQFDSLVMITAAQFQKGENLLQKKKGSCFNFLTESNSEIFMLIDQKAALIGHRFTGWS